MATVVVFAHAPCQDIFHISKINFMKKNVVSNFMPHTDEEKDYNISKDESMPSCQP